MKILSNLLLCALVMCASSSCQKDEDDLPITVQGKWKITAVACHNGIQTVYENGATSGGAFVFDGQSFSSEVEFNSNATFKGSGSYTKVFSTLVNGTMQTDRSEASNFATEGNWSTLDSNLELTNDDLETFEIVELTSQTMRLKSDLNETIRESEHVTINNVGTIYFTLNR